MDRAKWNMVPLTSMMEQESQSVSVADQLAIDEDRQTGRQAGKLDAIDYVRVRVRRDRERKGSENMPRIWSSEKGNGKWRFNIHERATSGGSERARQPFPQCPLAATKLQRMTRAKGKVLVCLYSTSPAARALCE